MGLYEYFDALRREHPHPIIDSSASGGRRIDFEMLSGRSIHVLSQRPDLGPRAAAEHDGVLSYWVPFHGVGTISRTPYDVRSGMGAVFGLAGRRAEPVAINVRDLPSSAIKRQVAELRDLGDLFLGDYYPLKSALFVYERVR